MTFSRAIISFVLLVFLASGGIVFAHGGAETEAAIRHPETQIGLPGSRMGHDEMESSLEGLTRSQVAALIEETQAIEEKRSAVKLTLLFLAIAGLAYLYFPRKAAAASSAVPQEAPPAAP